MPIDLASFWSGLAAGLAAFAQDPTAQLGALLEIAAINLILSGDNAVVIALACRNLPRERRRTGLVLGSAVAIVLRIAFTALVAALLATPFLKLVAGALLIYVAVKLVLDDDDPEPDDVRGSDRLWSAIRTIAVADAIMSLDNVLAIAAAAHGSTLLLVFGLLISIPLIVAGAALIAALLDRLPILLWAGAALLGWAAGSLAVSDPWLESRFGAATTERWDVPVSVGTAILVLLVAAGLRRLRRKPDQARRARSD